jgi:hypothetical protein
LAHQGVLRGQRLIQEWKTHLTHSTGCHWDTWRKVLGQLNWLSERVLCLIVC